MSRGASYYLYIVISWMARGASQKHARGCAFASLIPYMPVGAQGVSITARRLHAVSHALTINMSQGSDESTVRAIIPNIPSEFVARLQAEAEAAGRSLELLVAQTPEEATELLVTEANVSFLIDAVEMGAPTRW